jgi:pimeloyl-ACP methyl ester carboxylesterase
MEETRRVTYAADGTALHFSIAGNGPPLLFLHGSLSSPATFRRLHAFVPNPRRLISPTMRGHDVEAPTLPADYGITTEIGDVTAVLDAEDVDRCDVVAHSTGGTTAVALARSQPDRIGRMVLIEPTLIGLLHGSVMERIRADIRAINAFDERGDHLAALNGLLDFIGSSAEPAARQRALDSLAPLAAPHLRALLEFPVTDGDIRVLRASTLLIYGAESAYFEAPIAARLGELRPDFLQLHIPAAGHLSHIQRPELVGPALAAHLDLSSR